MPFEVFNVNEYLRKTCEENPKFRDLYIKMQPDEKIMRTICRIPEGSYIQRKSETTWFQEEKASADCGG